MNLHGRPPTSDFSSVFAQGSPGNNPVQMYEKTRDSEMIEIDPNYSQDQKTGYIPEHDICRQRGPKGQKGRQ